MTRVHSWSISGMVAIRTSIFFKVGFVFGPESHEFRVGWHDTPALSDKVEAFTTPFNAGIGTVERVGHDPKGYASTTEGAP